jgi:hypothetical protein
MLMSEGTTGRGKGSRQPPPRGPGSRKEDWIASQLRRVYDDALRDPIPPEMLDLLGALDNPEEGLAEGESEKDTKA